MAASYVNLVLDVFAGSGSPAPMGYAKLSPSATLTDAPDQMWIPPIPVEVPFTGSADPAAMLLATDGGGPQPAGWTWGITFPGVPGQPSGFSFFLPAGPAAFTVTDASPAVFTFTPTAGLTEIANGTGVRLASPPTGFSAGVTYYVVASSGFTFELAASAGGPPIASQSSGSGSLTVAQANLSALAPAEAGTAFASYLPLTSGTPSAGQVPTFTGSGFATAPGNPASSLGTVTSVSVATANGLAGSVANPTTTPAVTLSTTASGVLKGAGGAVQAATAGTDYVAPTGSGAALTGITAAQVGADASGAAAAAQSAAVGSSLQKSANLSDLASASTARTNLGLGTAATQSTSAFDASGAASAALTSAESFATGLQPTSGSPLPLAKGGTGVSEASAAALVSALGALLASSNLSDVGSAATARTNLGLGSAAVVALTSLLQSANNLSDLASVSTARTNLGLGSAATQNSSAFDAAGAAASAQAAAQAASLPATDDLSAIAAANATAGNVAMNSRKLTGLANGSVSTDSAAFGQIPTALPPNGAASGDLAGTYPGPTVAKINGTAFTLPVSIANGGTGTATGAPQNDVLAGPATGGAGAPAFRALVAADLPAATTGAQGAVQLDGTSADIAALGTRAAGAIGKAADAGHVHPTTGVMVKVADTGTAGYALTNGTGVITGMSWTAPSDGNLHLVSCAAFEYVTSAETGGACKLEATTTQGPTMLVVIFAGGAGTGIGQVNTQILVESGQSVSLQQTSALTAGASTLYAQIWAS